MANATSLLRLKVDSSEFDPVIKKARQGLQSLGESLKASGKTFSEVDKNTVDYIRAIGKMDTANKTAKGQVNELSSAFVDLSKQYNNLTQIEKQSPAGKAMAQSMEMLKKRAIEARRELADLNKQIENTQKPNVGGVQQYSGIINDLGHKMGIAANVTDLLTSKTALLTAGIGASVTAVVAATKAWAEYNSELAMNDNATMVTTKLEGPEANRMTDAMMSVSKVYGVDFREAINAANTLMSQFGVTGDEAIQLIRDGMQGMIQGDGPKLLSMIQQYAPSFHDAGISAQQLVAIIHNSEGGIFTDQNMNAIVMGIKNIRLMTKSTSDALAQLGIDGKKMSEELSNGTISIFDAMQQVMKALQGVESGSQTAGEVMQTVFGRQGAAAGTNLAKAIETLNLNLDKTKRQTGDVGESIAKLEIATGELNEAFRECFGWDGWQQMATGIKTKFVEGLTTILHYVDQIEKHVKWVLQNLDIIDRETPKIPPKRWDDFELDSNIVKDAKRKREEARERIRNKKPTTTTTTTKSTHTGTDPVQQAAEKVAAAQHEYEQSIEKAKMSLDNGTSTEADYKKKLLSAEERLWDALGDAYNIHKDPKYKLAQDECAKKIQQLGGEVTASVEAQKQAQEAARQLAQTQKKVNDALDEAARAYTSNNLKGYLAAQKKIGGDAGAGMTSEAFSYTSGNLEAFIGDLKERIKTSDLGSDLYNSLTKQLADATALGNLMQEAIKQGIDITQFSPQELWQKVFGDNPGDYIEDSTWQALVDKINEELKKRGIKITLDTTSGSVSSKGDSNQYLHEEGGKTYAKVNDLLGGMASGVGQIVSGIEQLGVEIPEGIKSALNFMQGISSILTGISTTLLVMKAIQTADFFKLFSHGGVVHAANGFSGVVPGNRFSGDQIPALLNSGEVVLNRAQNGVLADELQNSGGNSMTIVGELSGEKIILVANRYLKRTGQGEIVTWSS